MTGVHFALRSLRKAPGFALAVAVTLALGIGANSAIFTVINTVVLHPLPYPDAERIVSIASVGDGHLNEPLFGYLEQNNPGLEDLSAYHAGARMNLNGGDRPDLVDSITASRNYFHLFGARPLVGRAFTPEEDRPGGPRVLVMSYGLWQRSFGGQVSVLGKSLTLGGAPYTVVGVLAPGFQPYPPADVWIPLQADAHSTNIAGVLTVAARLPAGVTIAVVSARVTEAGRRSVQANASEFRGDPKIHAETLQQQMTGAVQPALWLLLGAVGLVLLIACANVASLLLARAASRHREMAIRAALGANGGRLVRQMLSESLLLALAGGALGLALASWGVRGLLAFMPGDLPRLQELVSRSTLDPKVSGFAFLLAAVTGILCGWFPGSHLTRGELAPALQESGGRGGTGKRTARIRSLLVAAEMALAVVLLCGAVLLIRSFVVMRGESLGFDPHQVLTMEISLAGPGYSQASRVDRFAREFTARAEQIPGVASVAVASALPLFGQMDMIFNIPGRTLPAGRRFAGDVQWRLVSPHYFETLRIPLLTGRLPRDRERGRTVVINQALARRYWPESNPVGQTLDIGQGLGPVYEVGISEIIGVVGDVRERLDLEPAPVMYQTPAQIPDADIALLNSYEPAAVLIRTRLGVAPLSVRRAIQQTLLAEQLWPGKVRTMEQVSLDSTARHNFNLLLMGIFAAIALLLGAVGTYGVMSYSVEQRTRELGIRAALGANRRDILAMVLRQGLLLALAGIAAGLAAAFGLTRLLRAELVGVTSADPLTFVTVPVILLAVAVAASAWPAMRASRVDPLVGLRHE